MTMKLETMNRARLLYRLGALGAGLLWLAGACGGQTTGTPVLGSESHFLMRCTDDCGGELSCIAGLCTKSCIAGVDECTGLASTAVCTNQSVEPGAVAVCDVSCTSRSDCAALGDGHASDAGFCRLAAMGSSAPLGEGTCGAYLDQIPPPAELPGVTIVNATDHTLYVHPRASICPQQASLVLVTRPGPDAITEVNIQGSLCATMCNAVAAEGWRVEGEGTLDISDCIGFDCVGPPAPVPIEPGQSLVEPARLEWVAERLPRGCAAGITTDAVNCYKRVIPPPGTYNLSVQASDQPDCTPPACTPVVARTSGNWSYEPLTIELLGP